MKLRKFSALLLSLLMLMSLAACGGSGAESGGQSGSNDQNEITEFVSPFAVAKKGETIRGFSIYSSSYNAATAAFACSSVMESKIV